jgi:hypothetical protein
MTYVFTASDIYLSYWYMWLPVLIVLYSLCNWLERRKHHTTFVRSRYYHMHENYRRSLGPVGPDPLLMHQIERAIMEGVSSLSHTKRMMYIWSQRIFSIVTIAACLSIFAQAMRYMFY